MHHRKKSGLKNRKLTIGFLAGNLSIQGLVEQVYSSILKTAELYDINTMSAFGAKIRNINNILIPEITTDSLYLFNSQNIDGLIIWVTNLSDYMEMTKIRSFINGLAVPVVCLGSQVGNAPLIEIDNKQGIRIAMQHLVENHGFRKIGFIRAQQEHRYAVDRLAGYLEALKMYNIPVDDTLITPPGDFTHKTGKMAAETFFDERKLHFKTDIEAIIASSDTQIRGILEDFGQRGIKVPQDIALIGFNNKLEAKSCSPGITTVDPLFSLHGQKAVEAILALIEGKKVPEQIHVPTELVIRQSCGCFTSTINRAYAMGLPGKKNRFDSIEIICKKLEEKKPAIIKAVNEKFKSIDKLIPLWCHHLIDKFILDISGLTTDNFLGLFESCLFRISRQKADILHWTDIISEIRNSLIPFLNNTSVLIQAENIFHKARILLSHMIEFSREVYDNNFSLRNSHFVEVGQFFNSALTIEDLKDHIEAILPGLGITRYYMFFYEKYNIDSQYVKLIASNDNLSEQEIIKYDSLDIKEFFHKYTQFNIIYKPLYLKAQQFGFILFNVELENYIFYEAIKRDISTALNSILYIEKEKRIKVEREKLLENLEDRNIRLSKAMHALQGEMELAGTIQTSLLPKESHIEGFKISVFMQPAAEVGGDFYNIMEGKDGNYWIHIGDVTGHGITSGLIMLILQTSLSSNVLSKPELTPGELTVVSNKVMWYILKSRLMLDHMITNCFFKFNREGHFTYAGAHLDILIYRRKRKKVERLQTTGVWLGLKEDISDVTVEKTFRLDENDVLFLYTNGLIECRNAEKEIYTIDRLILFLQRHGELEPEEISQKMINEIENFRDHQQDDYSFIIVKKES